MMNIKTGPIIPLPLHRRINRLIKTDDILFDETSIPEEHNEPKLFNDDLQLRDDKIFVEPRLEPKPLSQIKTNWFDEFCRNTQKDRIIWESKLHEASRRFANKSMYEQVEDLMDISAEDFSECINKLADDEQHQISKEMIKKLFSIEIENDISNSLFVQKTHKPYVSEEIAELFECPELAIERNIRKLMKQDKKSTKVSPKYHAFGRSLSPASKQIQKIKFTEPEPFNFPEDIRSGENLFHGIDQLKSTKALINYFDEHNLPKPKYLSKMNALKSKSKNTSQQTPLYSDYQ
ncbi:uncharacterized protein LOC116347630 [Contarinia nasturtii]|uniref:uncharacterized protein LOC116347630 n=1 Tax=Contarinia nasturtii TaxID=265458 RepID=UPI0012D498FF|nr:uncharacterized protein LOC116347630 [Contarinia nasturtii]